MKRTATILTLAMLVVSAAIPLSAAAGSTQQETYAGSHVTFETTESAVVDYRVDGAQTVDSVRVQSQSETESDLGLGASADVVASADIAGSTVSVDSQTEASARMQTESGATIEGHDNGHGSLVVSADEQSQYVAVDLNDSTETEQVSDERVVFTTDDGTRAAAMVVGEGNVSVTEQGNLTAALDQDSRLVVRSYTDARSEADAAQESMIVDGTAAASVYVMEQGGQQVTDTVNYTEDTSVEVTQRSEQRVEMTVSRAEHDGRVVIAHLSDAADSASDIDVRVDGEAAVQASSYSEVRQATDGAANSKYVVESTSEASAQTQVVLGINHFSTRSVTMDGDDSTEDSTETATDGDDETATETGTSGSDETDTATDGESDESTDTPTDSDDTDTPADSDDTGDSADATDSSGDSDGSDDETATTSGNGPGFGVVVSVLALLAAAVLARRH